LYGRKEDPAISGGASMGLGGAKPPLSAAQPPQTKSGKSLSMLRLLHIKPTKQ